MEAVSEYPSLALQVTSLLQKFLPDFQIELHESGDKKIIVCDYQQPIRLDWRHSDTPEETKYREFWQAYLDIFKNFKNIPIIGENFSSKGQTDLLDVRAIVNQQTREVVYLMPESEWQKLNGKPFESKSEKIVMKASRWLDAHQDSINQDEVFAFLALAGEHHRQIVPVTAGLKPVSIELPINPILDKFINSRPHLRNLRKIKRTPIQQKEGQAPSLQIVYHLPAVQKIIQEHKELFESLGFSNKNPEQIITELVDDYDESQQHLGAEQQESSDRDQALGLLLGFDAKSCKDYATHDFHTKKKPFIPPDHAEKHSFNTNPFNFYNVDYWISDPENNEEYKALKNSYDKLVQKIEELLDKGLSPLEALAALNEEYLELRTSIVNEVKRATDKLN